jgi:hypothetical protein
LKNLKELLGFMKEPEKKWWFVGNYLTLSKNEKGGIYHSRVFDFWRPAKNITLSRPHILDPTCKAVGALLRKSRSSTRFRLQAAYTFGRSAELLTLGLSEPPSSSPIFCQVFILSHHPTLCERDRD